VAIHRLLARHKGHEGIHGIPLTPREAYQNYDPRMSDCDRVFNAGLFTFSPALHRELLEHVYHTYEDKGDPSYYENQPLSYEFVHSGLVHWLDQRYNHLWSWEKELHYPFLNDLRPCGKGISGCIDYLRTFPKRNLRRVAGLCMQAALANCYCLHFAGSACEMRYLSEQGGA
jgi:hypothetical protein